MSTGRSIKLMVKHGYRQAMKNGQKLVCGICDKPINYQSDLSIDHILAKANGGTNSPFNFQPSHYWCNKKKDRLSQEDARKAVEYLNDDTNISTNY